MFCDSCSVLLDTIKSHGGTEAHQRQSASDNLHHQSFKELEGAIKEGCCICKRLKRLDKAYHSFGQPADFCTHVAWQIVQDSPSPWLSLTIWVKGPGRDRASCSFRLVPVRPENGMCTGPYLRAYMNPLLPAQIGKKSLGR